jgi:hypothetical protein
VRTADTELPLMLLNPLLAEPLLLNRCLRMSLLANPCF